MNRRGILCIVAALLGAAPQAGAQDWPTRPVTIVIPFAPGGSGDASLRLLAKALSEKIGQPVIVENRSGAGGAIGAAAVAKAAPDGYTLLFTAIGPHVLNKLLYKSIPYDPDADFEPIILVADVPQIIVSSPRRGWKNLGDLIAYAKQHPGQVTIGHAGAGTMGHLAAALFAARAGIEASLIGYRGATPVVTDVFSGHIDAGFPIYIPLIDSVTALAVTAESRAGFLPQVPTAREAGVDVVASTWTALVGPAGLPRDIVMKLNAAVHDYLADDETARQFATLGMRPLGGPPERLVQTIADDKARWEPIIRAENIKLDPQ
jgi:tripartite-type tricarboxylate transporter receptor subunit TctC